MPENYFESIAQRVAEIAKKTVQTTNSVRTGTVISTNPDGSVNVDDGQGGCTRISNLGSQLVQCGQTVILGLEPQIGTVTNLCQVQFAIEASSKDCPLETRTDETEVDPPMSFAGVLATSNGRLFLAEDLIIDSGGDYTYNNLAYGYSDSTAGSVNTYWVGAAPNYQDVEIGHYNFSTFEFDGSMGDEALTESGTNIVRGVGLSADRLFGIELALDASGGSGPLKMAIRDATTYALLAEDPGTFLSDWLVAHEQPNGPFIQGGVYETSHYNWHVSADPFNGTFWLSLNNYNQGPRGSPALNFVPIWNISSADGSMIGYYELADGTNTMRAERISEIVPNGNFEQGETLWEVSVAGLIYIANQSTHQHVSVQADSKWHAFGPRANGTYFVKQVVTPVTMLTTATLELWLRSDAAVGSAGQETFSIEIRDAAGTIILETLATYDNTSSAYTSWTQLQYDITAYIGQAITLYFKFVETQASNNFGFYLDDVRITA